MKYQGIDVSINPIELFPLLKILANMSRSSPDLNWLNPRPTRSDPMVEAMLHSGHQSNILGGSINGNPHSWMVDTGKSQLEEDDLVVALLQETPIFSV